MATVKVDSVSFKTVGAYKNAHNIPNYKATAKMHNGELVVVDHAAKTVSPVGANVLKDQYIVMNLVTEPESDSEKDVKIEIGSFVRAFAMASIDGQYLEFSCTDGAPAVGDIYTADANGDMTSLTSMDANHSAFIEVTEAANGKFTGIVHAGIAGIAVVAKA